MSRVNVFSELRTRAEKRLNGICSTGDHAKTDPAKSLHELQVYAPMQGFGVHPFRLVNDAGKSSFVKFHWQPKYGTLSLVWDEAVKISGADPDYHRRDLWERIEAGVYPEWELGMQIFS